MTAHSLPAVDAAPASPATRSISLAQKLLVSAALALLLWLPRGLALDTFVAVDERSWLTRAGNFYLALTDGDWAATFQRYHPGVTTMWLGMGGFLWRYPDYPADAAGQIGSMAAGIEDFLAEHDHPPLELLAAARALVVLAHIGVLLAAFWIAVDLLGGLAALTGVLLIAFEPFLLGLSRMLHVDGLSSSFMLLALLAYFRYRQPDPALGGRRRDLVVSGVAAGLAWLSKSPALFLIPFVGVVALIDLGAAWRQGQLNAKTVGRTFVSLVVWGLIGAAVFVALWPAMWVDPLGSLTAIFSAAGESAAEGHSKALYFNGAAIGGDPGVWFYPITFLWRTTPVTLLGATLAVAGWLWAWRRAPAARPQGWPTVGLLLLFALAFLVFMTLGSKKFPRYLLPLYMPLDLAAGAGYVWALGWVAASALGRRTALLAAPAIYRWALPIVVGVQAVLALPHFPYYFTYYNPLLGGSARAPEVMMIGLGEGLDAAARYLNAKPDAEDLTAASWYRGGSFNYVFAGHDLDIEDFYRADYAVIYAHQWQRRVPDDRLLDYFAGLAPEHVVTLHGLDYAWVYNLADAPPPDYFTDWAEAIRLVEVEQPATPVQPGEPFVVRLRLYVVGDLDHNLNVVVRLVDAAGTEVARSEGWPFGSATSTWQPGEVYVDGHEFTLPPDTPPGYYRVEAGFYDAETQALVTPVVAGTDTPRADLPAVGYVAVGPLLDGPAVPLEPPVVLGDGLRFLGAELGEDRIPGEGAARLTVTPGARVPLTLFWQATRPSDLDYTVLLHLIGPDGQPVAQGDGQPALPATLWQPDTTVVDPRMLALPEMLAPGEYPLVAGLYDLATLQRLPATAGGEPAGDTVPLGVLVVE
jgi:hypothetical protein